MSTTSSCHRHVRTPSRPTSSAQGIKAASTTAKGMGESEPVSRDCSDKLAREALVQCLQPDRRVSIEITGTAR